MNLKFSEAWELDKDEKRKFLPIENLKSLDAVKPRPSALRAASLRDSERVGWA